jgi:hypothetical protein
VNARRTPQEIISAHGSNKLSRFFGDCRPTGFSVPDLPGPVPTEALAVPANYGARLEDRKGRLPSRPEPREEKPESAIRSSESRPRTLPLNGRRSDVGGQDLNLSLSRGPKMNAERDEVHQK